MDEYNYVQYAKEIFFHTYYPETYHRFMKIAHYNVGDRIIVVMANTTKKNRETHFYVENNILKPYFPQ